MSYREACSRWKIVSEQPSNASVEAIIEVEQCQDKEQFIFVRSGDH